MRRDPAKSPGAKDGVVDSDSNKSAFAFTQRRFPDLRRCRVMTGLAATLQVLDGVSGPDSSGNWRGACPKCGDRIDNPSLSIKQSAFGVILFNCFRGCALADIAAVVEARRASGQRRGAAVVVNQRRALSKDETFAWAMRLWLQAKPAAGTVVERYLRSRGIKLLPPTLRFHPGLKHPTGGYHPAMIAIVTDSDAHAIGVHRTFLGEDGRKADVEPVKMALGSINNGAVRLVATKAIPAKLAVAEGIETALSIMQMNPGLDAWAALSTSGLRNVVIPAGVREVVVCADGDDAGDKAARCLEARLSYSGKRRVRIISAPRGKDFNDLLLLRRKVKLS